MLLPSHPQCQICTFSHGVAALDPAWADEIPRAGNVRFMEARDFSLMKIPLIKVYRLFAPTLTLFFQILNLICRCIFCNCHRPLPSRLTK